MAEKKKVYAVSACLVGKNCKYNGGNNRNEAVLRFLNDKEYITVCPESLSGLKIPREPSEIKEIDGMRKVFSKTGEDVTDRFYRGAEKAFQRAIKHKATAAVMKERSPSCGVHFIYDGTFTSNTVPGMGIASVMFAKKGIVLMSEEDIKN